MALNWNAMIVLALWTFNEHIFNVIGKFECCFHKSNELFYAMFCRTNEDPFGENRITILEDKSNKDIKTYVSVYTNWALSIEMEPRIRRRRKHIWKGGNLRYKSHRFISFCSCTVSSMEQHNFSSHGCKCMKVRYERQRRRCTRA